MTVFNMKSITPVIFTILVSLPFFSGCEKIRQLPPEPVIEFRQFTMYDTVDILGNPAKAGILKFYFEDGDGDLGLKEPGEGETDTTNLFFTLYTKEDGIFTQVDESDPNEPSDYRIPYMDREGQNKILQGTIEITFLYFFYDITDTIKYDFFARDRAGNESNIDSTCEIPFSLNGICVNE
ncbi:MAG TPA: hypothetical protein DEQ09_12010 [Bacteroidales bacterium]|nr:hypothetical protein [Bacteroidales bacterium]